ncbi:hypothetical protein CDL60_13615 [Roseateles noduli]|nr:hypothetical protein CDL60_13615 [Roseateles noduli]
MSSSMNKLRWLIPVALALTAGLASAQHHGGGGARVDIGLRLDSRYHHDHYYPAPGYVARGLPGGAVFVGNRYWYHGGVWYQPWGPSFRVIAPPLGFVVPILPSAYVSLRIGGYPYYYANGAYYTMAEPGPGYVVVAPPPGADAATPAPVAPPRPDPIIYPRNGQSAGQTEADRQECNRWATTQPSSMNDAGVFNRAVEACMDGRGYSMR